MTGVYRQKLAATGPLPGLQKWRHERQPLETKPSQTLVYSLELKQLKQCNRFLFKPSLKIKKARVSPQPGFSNTTNVPIRLATPKTRSHSKGTVTLTPQQGLPKLVHVRNFFKTPTKLGQESVEEFLRRCRSPSPPGILRNAFLRV